MEQLFQSIEQQFGQQICRKLGEYYQYHQFDDYKDINQDIINGFDNCCCKKMLFQHLKATNVEHQHQIYEQLKSCVTDSDPYVIAIEKLLDMNCEEKDIEYVMGKLIISKQINDSMNPATIYETVYNKIQHNMQRISRLLNGKIYNTSQVLKNQGTFTIDVQTDCNIHKSFQHKVKIGDFIFQVHLIPVPDPNINVNDNFVQLNIKLAHIPSNISNVTIYFNFVEHRTNTQYQVTKTFQKKSQNKSQWVGWCQRQLSLNKCLRHKQLEFGYNIQILRSMLKNRTVEHSNMQLQWIKKPHRLCWKIEKYMLSTIKYNKFLSIFYSPLFHNSFCLSIGALERATLLQKQPTIIIGFHLFRLPANVAQMSASLELMVSFDKKTKIYSENTSVFHYKSTNMQIHLNEKQSGKILSFWKTGITIQFQFTVNTVFFVNWISHPYTIENVCKQSRNVTTKTKLNGNKNIKTISVVLIYSDIYGREKRYIRKTAF
eukprot:58520_1